jgi:hypothetical protein
LKKGDLGGFENLQGERIYGKRYKKEKVLGAGNYPRLPHTKFQSKDNEYFVILNEAQRSEESRWLKKRDSSRRSE